MRPATLLLALALLAAGAWWLSGGTPERGPATLPDTARRHGTSGVETPPVGPSAAAPVARVEEPAPDPALAVRWGEVPLALPEGKGAVTGRDLLAAIEGAGVLSVKADEGDLAALRAARFPDVPRGGEMHHLVLEPLLREAGFDAVVRYPTLHLRKRPPERDPPR